MTDSTPTNDVIMPELKYNYFIRIRLSAFELTKTKIPEYLAGHSDVVCCVEHPKSDGPEATHCHVYVERCCKSSKNIRNGIVLRLNKGQEKITNGHYSVKDTYNGDPVNEGCVVYMSKGKYTYSFLHGKTDEWYNNLKAQWIDKSKAEQKPVVIGSVTRYTEFDAFLKIQDELHEEKWHPVRGDDNLNLAMRKIISVRKKLLHRPTGKKTMNDLLYALYNDEYIQDFSLRESDRFIFG